MSNLFVQFPSATTMSTSHNAYLHEDVPFTRTYRCWIPSEVFGGFDWKFWFTNTVDTTMQTQEEFVYHDNLGGHWSILGARVGIADAAGMDGDAWSAVTFGGNVSKAVTPGETFWSDTLRIDLPEGKLLVWEWTLQGNDIPYTRCGPNSSQVQTTEGTWEDLDGCPKPDLVGCNRPVRKRIVFFGDSITMGCCTPFDAEDHWPGRISKALGSDYSVWNLGSGGGRARDAADGTQWVEKAIHSEANLVSICLGVNDLINEPNVPETADVIVHSIETAALRIAASGAEIVLFNIPAFDFDYAAMKCRNWEAVNQRLPAVANKHGWTYYDIAEQTDCPGHRGHGKYEPHPTGYGHFMITEDIMNKIGDVYR